MNEELKRFLHDLMNPVSSLCLLHQLPENSTSPIGPVCECCKQTLYTSMPASRPMIYWESQPVAYTLSREPLFPLTIRWDELVIRSLHPNPEHVSHRYPPYQPSDLEDEAEGYM